MAAGVRCIFSARRFRDRFPCSCRIQRAALRFERLTLIKLSTRYDMKHPCHCLSVRYREKLFAGFLKAIRSLLRQSAFPFRPARVVDAPALKNDGRPAQHYQNAQHLHDGQFLVQEEHPDEAPSIFMTVSSSFRKNTPMKQLSTGISRRNSLTSQTSKCFRFR